MNFTEYVESQKKRVDESTPTMKELVDNFEKVFPYSNDKNVRVKHFSTLGDDTTDMKATGSVSSEKNSSDTYMCTAEFHRDDTGKPFSLKNIGKVSCTCKAYRYNLSHPNTKDNVQSEPIPSYASISNRQINPEKIPGVCKHLFSFLHFLYTKGIIRN